MSKDQLELLPSNILPEIHRLIELHHPDWLPEDIDTMTPPVADSFGRFFQMISGRSEDTTESLQIITSAGSLLDSLLDSI